MPLLTSALAPVPGIAIFDSIRSEISPPQVESLGDGLAAADDLIACQIPPTADVAALPCSTGCLSRRGSRSLGNTLGELRNLL